jgi:hypothetical protein
MALGALRYDSSAFKPPKPRKNHIFKPKTRSALVKQALIAIKIVAI